MYKKYSTVAIWLLATGFISAACADNVTPPDTMTMPKQSIFSFSSFGTIGVVQTNTDNGIYTTGTEKNGATTSSDFGPDTKLGGQLDAKFNDYLSATVQLFSKQNAVGSYNPDVEWAFGKLKMGNGFSLRLGRIGAPFFMSSDFRNVGYTNITVRTPVDVYALVPVRSFDGGDILYETSLGNTTLNGQFWMGRSSVLEGENASGDEQILLHNIAGINFSAENGPFTVRFGTMKTRLGTSGTGLNGFNGLLGELNQASGLLPALSSLGTIANDLAIDNKFATFTDLGIIFDSGNWIASSEVVKRKTESTYISTVTAWYATLGYRIQKFTPYLSFSGRNVNSVTSVSAPAITPLLPAVDQQAVLALVGGANSLLISTNEKTGALGVRWDAGKNYDIKAEYQQIQVPAGSAGIFSKVTGGSYTTDTHVSVFSLCLDFVF
ncbi:hypothetical protein [Solimicrobium silvestre]|uniref:Uncharacterized protein n=1 Tax=Solimicrobium silvestre TaxID=2099400 RepID=A0A2S9GUB6_9BURK|nr:hypothetical protein [Solimicrobium silvestre]PRC91298.1 hypothetical protein S2091_3969 [Solimicrobium silvestre]